MTRVDWKKARKLWGKSTDREIGAAVGCTAHAVAEHRAKHNIVAKNTFRVDWSKAESIWGQATDAEIALVVGCALQTVTTHRHNYNIPAFKKHRPPKLGRSSLPSDLGKVPDEVIAKRESVSLTTVQAWRRNRGIPAFRDEHAEQRIKDKRAEARAKYAPSEYAEKARDRLKRFKEREAAKNIGADGAKTGFSLWLPPEIALRVNRLALSTTYLTRADILREIVVEGLPTVEARLKTSV